MRKFFYVGALSLTLGVAASTASAHAMLDRASPPVGGSVSGSPGQIRLWFTQALERRFSGAEVIGPSGSRVGGSASASGNQLTISVPRLGPGTYRVNWHVISVDTHKTEGSFTFEVRP
jgi:methionine-rich copper-binding protein CopC